MRKDTHFPHPNPLRKNGHSVEKKFQPEREKCSATSDEIILIREKKLSLAAPSPFSRRKLYKRNNPTTGEGPGMREESSQVPSPQPSPERSV
jgi:hypothetical protein